MSEASNEPWLRLQVTPEPSPDEAEALAAAIAVHLSGSARAAPEPERPVSRWLTVGRRAAIRSLAGGSTQGWGRERPGWTRER
jgi:hypothetical protein